MENSHSLRQHVANLLTKGESHLDARSVLEQFPRDFCGRKPPDVPYTPWQLLEHMRIVQWDILRFSLDPSHISPKWPDDCWPKAGAPPSNTAWDESVKLFLSDLDDFRKMVYDPELDLLARIPHGNGETFLREAFLVADHNSYHIGQLVMLRRILEER